jgi:3-dehydroquinate synthase
MAATSSLLDSQSFPWLRDEPAPSEPQSFERVAFSFEYPVHFTNGVFSWENLTLVRAIARRDPRRRHEVTVVVDPGVASAHLLDDIGRYVEFHHERIQLGGTIIFHEEDLVVHPQSFVVAVGGGALQDAVARVAASVRGSRVIRVPTTVTAQAMAHVPGPYALPFAVINDFEFLETLSPRDTHAGTAEPLRLALAHDASLFGWLRLHAPALAACEPNAVREMIRRTARVHHADPFDPPIALGEWTAQHLGDRDLRYGEAIALGSALDVVYSAAAGVLDTDALDPIVSTMQGLGLPTYHPALSDLPFHTMRRVSILERVGCASETSEIDPQLMHRAIDWLRHRG